MTDGVRDGFVAQVARDLDHRLARLEQHDEALVGVGDLNHHVEQLIKQSWDFVALHQLLRELEQALVRVQLGHGLGGDVVGDRLVVERELQFHAAHPDAILLDQAVLAAPPSVDVQVRVLVGDRDHEVATIKVDVRVGIRQQGIRQKDVDPFALPERSELLVDVVHLHARTRHVDAQGRHGVQSLRFWSETEVQTGAKCVAQQDGQQVWHAGGRLA